MQRREQLERGNPVAQVELIRGIAKVVDELRRRAARARQDDEGSVIVGYTAAYALYVHEKVEMKWKGLPRGAGFGIGPAGEVLVSKRVLQTGRVGGGGKGFYWDPQGHAQAKFLEGPARELSGVLGGIVREAFAKGKTLIQGLLLAGLRLQRESQLRVPVDTGNLKNSAFTRLE